MSFTVVFFIAKRPFVQSCVVAHPGLKAPRPMHVTEAGMATVPSVP